MSESRKIGLRIQDIADGLKDVQATGAATKFKNTLLMGKAASLALHIKGLDVIHNMEAFEYAAGELGIGLELDHVLKELQEIEFIRKLDNKIEVTVPKFSDTYEIIAQRWQTLSLKESEIKTVEILNDIENNPKETDKLQSQFDLDVNEKRIIYELGNSGAFLDEFFTKSGSKVTYSPALTELHPEKIFDFSAKNPNTNIGTLMSKIRQFQGMPVEQVTDQHVKQACYAGILLQTSIGLGQEKHDYVFAPMDKITPENKTVLSKARAVLSCVRHGQYHTEESTKINSAYAILNAMRTKKRLAGHPAHKNQYGLIITQSIARLSSVTASNPSLIIIDTSENMAAIDLAIEMLGYGSGRTATLNQDAQQALFQPNSYSNTSSTRVNYRKELKKSPETQKEIVKQISLMNQGIYDAFN